MRTRCPYDQGEGTHIRTEFLLLGSAALRGSGLGWGLGSLLRLASLYLAGLLTTLQLAIITGIDQRRQLGRDWTEYSRLGDHLPSNGVLVGACVLASHSTKMVEVDRTRTEERMSPWEE